MKKRKRRLVWGGAAGCALLLALVAVWGGYLVWTYHGPTPPTRIYRGITYSCERLPSTSESGGLLHLVKVDLTAPGVRFYITPMDSEAVARGWQFRLRYVDELVRNEGLAVGVNGTLFYSDDPFWFRRSGDWAHGVETMVANHVVSHVWQHTYLMWWDDDNVAHVEQTKPPSAAALAAARWGIGGQMVLLNDGKVTPWAGHEPDQRTMIAADPARKLVWLACFDRASYAYAGAAMAERGARMGILVDGGWSTSMALGADASGVKGGRVTGCWRPVADVCGFYAERE